eukprot:gnl/MRDRNA2_/MRDRNA2_21455_c0_seq1.p1 gnl/MRDRNA2_/MRDRNA2_21455_c0~~gnl/MRDRNA2_/MRDRNA2_21455_c0_seq1.p1  ORF type:complete len:224 (+),score=27.94 gnl/MRDRNA2_/MRDRNA2_21455_c0_seq1:17-688(+)
MKDALKSRLSNVLPLVYVVVALVVAFSAWSLRPKACKAYYESVTKFTEHAQELGPWSHTSSLTARMYASACGMLPDSVQPVTTELWNDPKVLIVDNFASTAEVAALLNVVKASNLKRSSMVTSAGKNGHRSSASVVLTAKEEKRKIIKRILKRMHLYARMPMEAGESLQFVRYEVGDKYELHLDSQHPSHLRLATALLYLNEVEGGETVFPMIGELNYSKPLA